MDVRDPKPGTDAAYQSGCCCPIIDNHHGKGRYGDGATYGWFMFGDCVIHGWTETRQVRRGELI